MIKSITLRNFKSHAATKVELSEGITVITGAPQVGKSNILRAIELVNTNRPTGFGYHSDFADEKSPTIITIETDRGKVTFKKTKSATLYTVIQNGIKHEFTKVGKSVPDKVLEVLKLDDINLDRQFDNPYLITSPPSEIAKAITKVVKYDKAVEWLSKLNKIVLSTGSDIRNKRSELISTKTNMECYEQLPAITELGNLVESLETKIDKTSKRVEDLISLKDKLSRLKAIPSVEEALLVRKQIEEIVGRIKDNKEALSILARLRVLSIQPTPIDKELSGEIADLDWQITAKRSGILDLRNVEALSKEEVKLKSTRKNLVDQLVLLLKKSKQCPVCKSSMTTVNLEHLKAHYKEDV